jgi:hypothetical protein
MKRLMMIAFISILITALGGMGLLVGKESMRLLGPSLAIKEASAAEKGLKPE